MTFDSDIHGLVDAMIAVAASARGPVTIGFPCVTYNDVGIRRLMKVLMDRTTQGSVSLRGVCCDASMIAKIGAERTDIYGAMLDDVPVSIRGPFDVVEVTLLARHAT